MSKKAPCVSCGTLMFGGRGSLPPGRRKCRPCRRAESFVLPQRPPVTHDKTCALCGGAFQTRYPHAKYCGATCRKVVREEAERQRTNTRVRPAAGKRSPGRSGYAWRQLRAQVLLEESTCGLCGLPIDLTVPYPHPMSPSVDHIVSLSQGGDPLDRANVRASHLRCNISRGSTEMQLARKMERLFWRPNQDLRAS